MNHEQEERRTKEEEARQEDRSISIDDFDAPSNYLGGAQSEKLGEERNPDTEDAILDSWLAVCGAEEEPAA
jgi:hypothetical protein